MGRKTPYYTPKLEKGSTRKAVLIRLNQASSALEKAPRAIGALSRRGPRRESSEAFLAGWSEAAPNSGVEPLCETPVFRDG